MNVSIVLEYSVLYWHIAKHSRGFIAVWIFNLQFFVRVFSKILIVDCAVVSSKAATAHYVYLAKHIENGLSVLAEMPA